MPVSGDIRAGAREALALYLDRQGHNAAATVLRAGNEGYMTLPRRMKDTRDGREEITQLIGEAFEDPRISVIVIEDGDPSEPVPLAEAIRQAQASDAPVPIQAYG